MLGIYPLNSINIFAGDYGGGVTPDPIPNSEVKPSRADGTTWATGWESRSLPALLLKPLIFNQGLF